MARMTIREIISALSETALCYPISFYGALKYKDIFEDIETYCMFIGYRRSGKTLTASLLDAHPNMIIADELGVLRYIHAGFTRKQIWYLLLEKSRLFTTEGRISKGYSHRIPGQWQGQFRKLRVIGDNKGQGAALRLRARPWLLTRLYKTMGVKIKLFHVVRNPYDNISSISKRMNKNLPESIDLYFSLCETVTDIKKRLNTDELLEFRHESFIADPKNMLKRICAFLGLDAPEDYLNDCAGIILNSPRKTRYHVQWDNRLTDTVKRKMSQFPYLKGYSYED